MSRPSQTKSPHVQTFVRSKLPMSRLLGFQKEKSCAPKLIICAFKSRLSCAQKTLCPDFRAFKIAYLQTIVRSLFFPDRVILNARRHLVRSFRSGHIDLRSGTSTWGTEREYFSVFFVRIKVLRDRLENLIRTL